MPSNPLADPSLDNNFGPGRVESFVDHLNVDRGRRSCDTRANARPSMVEEDGGSGRCNFGYGCWNCGLWLLQGPGAIANDNAIALAA
jgi:hypothetical protein